MESKTVSIGEFVVDKLGGSTGLDQLGAKKLQAYGDGVTFFIERGDGMIMVTITKTKKSFRVQVAQVDGGLKWRSRDGVKDGELRSVVKALTAPENSEWM